MYRESPSITVTKFLMDEGAKISIYDPKVEEEQIMMYVAYCFQFINIYSCRIRFFSYNAYFMLLCIFSHDSHAVLDGQS